MIGINITVIDRGAGISEQDQKCIFKPFFKSQTLDQNTSQVSHGLGLNIC